MEEINLTYNGGKLLKRLYLMKLIGIRGIFTGSMLHIMMHSGQSQEGNLLNGVSRGIMRLLELLRASKNVINGLLIGGLFLNADHARSVNIN